MEPSTEPVMQPEWVPESRTQQPSYDARNYLDQAQRFSLVRAHISVFALGSVLLLVVNLLIGSGSVWAGTWIGAWGLIVVMHAVIAGIAGLILQLLADDDDIRPASEVHWSPAETWSTRPVEPVDTWSTPSTSSPPPPTEEPIAASLAHQWKEPPPPPKDDERVSWETAAQVAWLARPTEPGRDDPDPPDAGATPSKPISSG